MIYKNRNSRWSLGKYLTVIPVIVIMLMSTAARERLLDAIDQKKYKVVSLKNITIEGIVRDEEGNLVKDATVAVKGTKNNAVTNEKGAFKLTEVETGSTVTISHSSYESFTIEVTGVTTLDVIILQKRSSFNVNSLPQINGVNSLLSKQQGHYKEADLEKASVLSIPKDYTIKMYCGERITEPGKEPLIVWNGKVWKYDLVMDKIKPDDVQSIEVMKTELSLAEYGPDAVNGVIILKTKKN